MDFRPCLNETDISHNVINKVPIIIGATQDEWAYFGYPSRFIEDVHAPDIFTTGCIAVALFSTLAICNI